MRTSTTQGAALFLGDTTLTQAAGSAVVCGFRTYTGAEGKPVAQRSAKAGTAGSVLSWLFTSLDGTVDVQTNAATGATVHAYRDPYGTPIAGTSQGWADSTGYLNKQVAEGTGLTNVGARTYDPVLGKFLSVDPVIDTNLPQQNTGYTYAGNNPTTYTDPTGLRLDEGCGWATTCKAAIAKGATGTPRPAKKQHLTVSTASTTKTQPPSFVRGHLTRNGQVSVSHLNRTPTAASQAQFVRDGSPDAGTMINPKWISGSINAVWGAVKIGSGITTLILGVGADVSLFGLPIGIPATLLGGYQIVTGAAKTYRGARQISQAESTPFVTITPESFVGEIVLGILPSFTSDVIDFVGGLL